MTGRGLAVLCLFLLAAGTAHAVDVNCPIKGTECVDVVLESDGRILLNDTTMTLDEAITKLSPLAVSHALIIQTDLPVDSCALHDVMAKFHASGFRLVLPTPRSASGNRTGWTLYPPNAKCTK